MIISCKDITKSYGVDLIIKDVSFQINEGERIALVGRNGTGKSTLFKIIAGELTPDGGKCIFPKNTTIGYLSQTLNLNDKNILWNEMIEIFQDLIDMEKQLRKYEHKISKESKSGNGDLLSSFMDEYGHLQEEFEKRNGYAYPSKIKGILTGLGFHEEDFQKEIMKFSGGQKTRIALAKLLLKEPDILLLDEPTNFLDLETLEWLEGFLSNYPNTLFIISHDRYFLDALVNRVFEIENHKLYQYTGDYSSYARYKKENLKVALHQYEQQQREIKRQQDVIEKFRSFNREKSIKQAESKQKRLDKIEVLDSPISQLPTLKLSLEPNIKSGRDVLKVENLYKSFGELNLFSNLNFQIYKGDHIGIVGPNGIGKSTLFKLILDQLKADQGDVLWGHNVFPAYYDQLQSTLEEDNEIIQEVWSAKPEATQTEIRNILAAFLFIGDDVYKNISTLSGGEKSRVSLAKVMLSNANMLLMDEPTNHLDIATKEVLEDALSSYKGTLMIISHDRYFLNKVANKIFVMGNGGIKEYLGNYQYYIDKKKQMELLEEASKEEFVVNKTQLKQERKKEREIRKAIKDKKQGIHALEKKIESLEKQIEGYENLMCEADFYKDADKALEITEEYEDTKKELSNSITQWEEAMLSMED